MFGYVVVDKPNILIKDYYAYRAYYCGLCKAIGKESGLLMRATLNYDIVLLALLGYNYEKITPEYADGNCMVHPLGKRLRYVKRTFLLDRIADINALLGYYKVEDDVLDENRHRLIKSTLTPYKKKAAKKYPELDKKIKACYGKLRECEKNDADLDKISDEVGYMLMAVADGLTDKCDRLLRELCFYLGKWIYGLDALDDIKKDFEKHNFNPFLRDVKEMNDTVIEKADEKARVFLYECIDRITECYDKMDITVSEGPLSNIIYRGLNARTEFVIKRRGEKWQETRLKF